MPGEGSKERPARLPRDDQPLEVYAPLRIQHDGHSGGSARPTGAHRKQQYKTARACVHCGAKLLFAVLIVGCVSFVFG